MKIKIGIIGGTGLDNPDLISNRKEKSVTTPFGEPSGPLVYGSISGVDVVILGRHGPNHTYSPTNVNYRANILALKAEGCTHVLATTCCGSLREDLKPGDLVILDQFIDRTTQRKASFYDGTSDEFKGVMHIPMHPAFCPKTSQVLVDSLKELDFPHHTSGTMVSIEGPRFSTKAESLMFRVLGADLINMTSSPEVPLAKEAGLCYASVALVTDYDCWREVEGATHVSVENVFAVLKKNVQKATKLLLHAIPKIAAGDWTAVIEANQKQVESSVF